MSKLKLLKDNKKWKDFKSFVNENIGDHQGSWTIWKNSFKCPCCDYIAINANGKNDYEGILKGLTLHLNAKIRLHGDKRHIRLFENLFGKDFILPILHYHKQKCIISAKNISEEINRIENFTILGTKDEEQKHGE